MPSNWLKAVDHDPTHQSYAILGHQFWRVRWWVWRDRQQKEHLEDLESAPSVGWNLCRSFLWIFISVFHHQPFIIYKHLWITCSVSRLLVPSLNFPSKLMKPFILQWIFQLNINFNKQPKFSQHEMDGEEAPGIVNKWMVGFSWIFRVPPADGRKHPREAPKSGRNPRNPTYRGSHPWFPQFQFVLEDSLG